VRPELGGAGPAELVRRAKRMTPAGRLQDYLKRLVQGSGGQYRKVRWEGRNGCPDCFIWWDWPSIAFVEIKAAGDRVSKVQDREIERMKNYGMPVYIARTNEDIDEIVKKVRRGVAT
jgi:hypothetical protein